MLSNQPRAASVQTIEDDTKCLWLSREMFNTLLGPLEMLLLANKRVITLRGVGILKSLSDAALEAAAPHFDVITFQKGQTIIRQGEVGRNFYIIEVRLPPCLVLF